MGAARSDNNNNNEKAECEKNHRGEALCIVFRSSAFILRMGL